MQRKYVVIIICICVAVIGAWYLSFFNSSTRKIETSEMPAAEYTADNTNLEVKNKTTMKVCISGEVLKPGVYEIKEGDRIEDVIKMAGGVSQNADLYGLNLAKYVNDQDNIIIPKKMDNKVDKTEVSTQNSNVSSVININTADKQALMSLDGIGEKLAEDIIAYRDENNGFKAIDEIKNVNRIGDAVYNKIKDKITV